MNVFNAEICLLLFSRSTNKQRYSSMEKYLVVKTVTVPGNEKHIGNFSPGTPTRQNQKVYNFK